MALVTGASGGIGRAIAAALRRCGGDASPLHYARAPDAAHATRREDRVPRWPDGGRSAPTCAIPTLRCSSSTASRRELGPIELLVNNAGVGRQLTWEQTTMEDFDESYAVNLRAPFLSPSGRCRRW